MTMKDLSREIPKIFLSYSWKKEDKAIADLIDIDFQQAGIRFIRDIRAVKYKDNLKDYMVSIRDADYALILLSDNYLRSKNCMFEAIQFLKEKEYLKKILPILVNSPDIFDSKGKLELIKYWQQEKEKLESELEAVGRMNSIGIAKELKIIDEIYDNIDFFLEEITKILNIEFEEVRMKGYKPLLEELNIQEVSHIVDLLDIINMKSLEQKEIALEEYTEKYTPNTYFYYLRGDLAEKKGEYPRALSNYQKAVEQDRNNAEALYRIGEIQLVHFNKTDEALRCFKIVLDLKPSHYGNLINLGTYYFNFKENIEKAKYYFKKAIELNPKNEKGYNNLAGCYIHEDMSAKSNKYMSKSKELLNEALIINPNYYDGLMTLGGYYLYYFNDQDKYEKYHQLAEAVKSCKDYHSISRFYNLNEN